MSDEICFFGEVGPAEFCQEGMLDAAHFLGGLGYVELREVGVVDVACFSGGVESDKFYQVGCGRLKQLGLNLSVLVLDLSKI